MTRVFRALALALLIADLALLIAREVVVELVRDDEEERG